MKTTKDIWYLMHKLCVENANFIKNYNCSPVCCSMFRISADMVLRGLY